MSRYGGLISKASPKINIFFSGDGDIFFFFVVHGFGIASCGYIWNFIWGLRTIMADSEN